jgi:hypothetical protein
MAFDLIHGSRVDNHPMPVLSRSVLIFPQSNESPSFFKLVIGGKAPGALPASHPALRNCAVHPHACAHPLTLVTSPGLA